MFSTFMRRVKRAWHKPVRGQLRSLRRELLRLIAPVLTHGRWLLRAQPTGSAHGLEQRVVVSLTSYPPRYGCLALTLKTLLGQSVRPDEVVLWLHEPDAAALPRAVRRLQARGLRIRTCPGDLRSYKKIVPQLLLEPQALIVTADDDVRYPPHWLAELIDGHRSDPSAVLCHRAHLPAFDAQGRLRRYHHWTKATDERGPDATLFFTGVGGVLYPPGSLGAEAVDPPRFAALCPDADDIWLNWMVRRRGTTVRRVGNNQPPLNWLGSQRVSLFRCNARGMGNDESVSRMAVAYGSGWLQPRLGALARAQGRPAPVVAGVAMERPAGPVLNAGCRQPAVAAT